MRKQRKTSIQQLVARLGGCLLLLILLAGCAGGDVPTGTVSLSTASPPEAAFARASGPKTLEFPADQGPHPDYQTEWWYYTGNLETPDGRHFGYELTFFRRALLPATEQTPRTSDWATTQVYMAHFALTDVPDGQFRAFQQIERGAAGLAGAQGGAQYRVWVDDWSVEETAPGHYHLQASQNGLSIDLTLADAKGPVLQGDQGYSQKGPQPGNASYYYSQTHLVSSGSVQVGGQRYSVQGLSWMDHEFSTSALAPGDVGWDWFALQLSDGSELMVYTLREADGSSDPYSSGTLVAPDGSVQHLTREDFTLKVESTWRSPHSGAVYPASWQITAPSAGLTLQVDPFLADQELNLDFTYWEGAVRVQGEKDGSALSGSGYVELTGYAQSMQGVF